MGIFTRVDAYANHINDSLRPKECFSHPRTQTISILIKHITKSTNNNLIYNKYIIKIIIKYIIYLFKDLSIDTVFYKPS